MSTRRGVLAFVLLVVVLGVVVLISALRLRHPSGSSAPAASSSSNSMLVFRVPEELEEAEIPLRSLFAVSAARGRSRLTTYDIANGLRHAAHDDKVRGLVLHIDGIDWGWGKIAEIRDALLEFRREGKPVYAALTGGSEREYLLASAASVVSLPPTASLDLDGLTLSTLHFKGTFDKLGITPNFAHVGQYKSAVEGYTRTEMSEPARAALEAVLDDEYRLLCDTLASARHTTPAAIAGTIDDGPFLATEARTRGLIDTLLHVEDVDSLAIRSGKDLSAESFDRYLDRMDEPRTGPRIALVVASGAIVPGRSRETPGQGRELGSLTLIQALREARTRRSIKAIVLRIDSPGGSAQATDDIWNEIARCRRVKPVIVSMADYGASGGYYMAVGGDSIVAQPATLTGSIGIFGGKLNVLGLYHKLGLNVETLSRGRHAQMLSAFRDFTPEEAAKFQHILEDFYRGFVARVARARHRSNAAIETVAQGRVWTGVSARHEGLVDALGGFETAFAMARAKAGIPRGASIVVERLPRVQRTFLQRMLEELVGDDDGYGLETLAPQFQALLGVPGIEALLRAPEIQAWLAAVSFRAGDGLMMMPVAIDIR